jgi:hypothetical protein
VQEVHVTLPYVYEILGDELLALSDYETSKKLIAKEISRVYNDATLLTSDTVDKIYHRTWLEDEGGLFKIEGNNAYFDYLLIDRQLYFYVKQSLYSAYLFEVLSFYGEYITKFHKSDVGMMARFKKIKIDSHLLVSELNNVVVNISSEKANRLVIGLNETQSKINFSIANLKSKSINDVSK